MVGEPTIHDIVGRQEGIGGQPKRCLRIGHGLGGSVPLSAQALELLLFLLLSLQPPLSALCATMSNNRAQRDS